MTRNLDNNLMLCELEAIYMKRIYTLYDNLESPYYKQLIFYTLTMSHIQHKTQQYSFLLHFDDVKHFNPELSLSLSNFKQTHILNKILIRLTKKTRIYNKKTYMYPHLEYENHPHFSFYNSFSSLFYLLTYQQIKEFPED